MDIVRPLTALCFERVLQTANQELETRMLVFSLELLKTVSGVNKEVLKERSVGLCL